jgi:TatD DNase family protein
MTGAGTTLIDTHCHLSFDPLWSNLNDVLARARLAGVTRYIVPAYDYESWSRIGSLAMRQDVFAAYGLHPWVADATLDIAALKEHLKRGKAVAVGEIGLDFKIERFDRQAQTDCLVRQLDLACEMKLPVLLHCRGAFEELLAILARYVPDLRGVIHAFTRGPQLAERFLNVGMHLAFGGGVTRLRAERVQRSATICPTDRLLLETDAPSIGLEGVNPEDVEPRHVADIAAVVAELRKTDLATLAEVSTRNAERLFSLSS